ncbi:MAG: hypothetical protein R3F33_15010 [Planctomycetota bacterium]
MFVRLLLACALVTSAQAQLPSIAICAADSQTCNVPDVQALLTATGRFQTVDLVDVMTATPLLTDLTAYDAVLVWSNQSFQSGINLGDVMADYVDAGGGVVVATFTNSTLTNNRFLAGRWLTGAYEVIQTQGGNQAGASTVGTVHLPGHPVMAGVSNITATTTFRPAGTTLANGSTLIAEWADGKILAAVGTNPHRVDIGLFPATGNCVTAYYDPAATDGILLFANALEYAADGGGVGSTFCDPAANNSTGVPARLTGSPSGAAGSGLHLDVDQGPPTSFGYFLIGTGASDPGTPISQGFLCLAVSAGNQFGRYNVVGGALNSVGQFDAGGVLQNVVGTSSTGSGFDVPAAIPSIGGVISAGQTWHFQAWFREAAGASNFSNGLSVTF